MRKNADRAPKAPHVPFYCLLLLLSHDPLKQTSSVAPHHMVSVKPNFFFFFFFPVHLEHAFTWPEALHSSSSSAPFLTSAFLKPSSSSMFELI